MMNSEQISLLEMGLMFSIGINIYFFTVTPFTRLITWLENRDKKQNNREVKQE